MKTFYITTAIDYVNSYPHIGTAYEKISADCIARAKRLLGYDVRFCMGTDEHSINVKKRATDEGLDPKTYCDGMVPHFERIWKKLSISYDDFIRTTDERHRISVTELFRRVMESGDIYTSKYTGWYCEGCEAFIQEKDLVDGKCPNHDRKPSWIEEENYFLKLSAYGDRLLEHIRANPDFIQPESRRNEIIRLIEGGLEDISVSRSGFDWGIPLPDDPDHVVYVWFDALINYISSLGFGSDDQSLFEKYWPAGLHVIGKDITRFHCVIWPAMLMSAGLPLPKTVHGHGFIYHRGEKMSKSLGNVVAPLDVVDRFGADPLRYFLLREIVYGQDGDFTFDRFAERYNSDLANDLGNLVSRTTTMIQRYLDGDFSGEVALGDGTLSSGFDDVVKRWTEAIEAYNISGACDIVWEYIRNANRLIEDRAPWKLAKDPAKKDELMEVLFDLASVLSGIAVLVFPYMPETAGKIWQAFGNSGKVEDVRLDAGEVVIPAPAGVSKEKASALFPRIEIEEETAMEKVPEKQEVAEAAEENDVKPVIEYDDFAKLDLRVGTVKTAEKVEKSKKLIRLTIDDGMEGRTILAGLAEHIEPSTLVDKQVVFVANLKPRKMMGEFSEGMVLAAHDDDGLCVLRAGREVKPGSLVS